ncbi:chloride channel protein [Propionibacterium sp.]|uniref:chloride channel protein n=1 Tax=Propionibacterium sp. TaxID=1977903 RepID=UPI0039ECE972
MNSYRCHSDNLHPRLTTIWVTLLTGIGAGLIGVAMSQLTKLIEWCAFGFSFSHAAMGVADAAWWRRLIAALVSGLAAGLLWTRIRPRPRGYLPTVNEAASPGLRRRAHLPVLGTIGDGLAQLMVVDCGMSLGREAPPRRVPALIGQRLSTRFQLDDEIRRVMIASAGGAGMAAVYNVPLAGAAYALEYIIRPDLRRLSGWFKVAFAVGVSYLATSISWLFNHNASVYKMPDQRVQPLDLLWVGAVALAGLAVALPLRAALRWSRQATMLTKHLWCSVPLASLMVAAIALWQPRIAGNGQVLLQNALTGGLAPISLALLGVLKGFSTVLGFRMGASGGLLTPSLAVGGAIGAMVASLSPAGPVTTAALVGAACVLSITESQPIFAALFAIELSQANPMLAVMVILGVAVTWAAHRLLPGGSLGPCRNRGALRRVLR